MQKSGALAVVLIIVVVLLVGTAGVLGWAVGDQTASKTVAAGQASASHMGGSNLPVSQIGDPARGARLWQSKHCSDCHSYAGRGGEDAPPLDSMRGHLSAREIGDMSGQIWNHVPEMLHHFKEEGIPFPTFTQGQMADLIAFLHSGKGAKAGTLQGHQGMTMPGMHRQGHMGGAQGKAVFVKAGCGGCHAFSAAGTSGAVGPNLDTLKGKSTAFIKQSILDPNAEIASGYQGGVMPTSYGSQLTDKQVDALVAFLKGNG